MSLRILSRDEIFSDKPAWREPGRSEYLAMYSSVFDGIITDPALMVVPADDHIINRGDAIFEYFPVHEGHAYCLEAHLERLQRSAEIVSLELPADIDTIRNIMLETVAITGERACGLRIFVSRGLGDFHCDPTSPEKSTMYMIVLKEPPIAELPPTVTAITTHVPLKPGFYAQVKTCCYMLNALVNLEAVRAGADYGIWYDEDGHLAESSIDSVAMVSKDGVFMYPRFEHILKGTGLIRMSQLAQELVQTGELAGVCQGDITLQDMYEAKEIYMLGSGDIFPVVKYDGRSVGTGQPGPIGRRLWQIATRDRLQGPPEVRTPIPYKK